MDLEQLAKQYREERDATRRKNLKLLVAKYGSARALAIAVSRAPQQIGQLLRAESPFGDRITKDIEEKLNLKPGYLDARDDDATIALTGQKDPAAPAAARQAKITRIPLLSTVQAGMPTDNGDLCFDEHIEVLGELQDGCYGLRVSGDSMSPLIDDGDIVIVNPNRWPRPGDCIVAVSELENLNEATIKRFYPIGFDETGREVFEARPFNDMYPTMHSTKQKLKVIGVVCKLIKDM